MPDISILNAGGTAYTIKDAVARTQAASAVTAANDANTTAQGAVAVAGAAQTAASNAQTAANDAMTRANAAYELAEDNSSGSATAQSAKYLDVTASNGILSVTTASMPVAVEINSTIYAIPGMTKSNGVYSIPTAPILAEANLASYTGTWRVWLAQGATGDTPQRGIDFWTTADIQELKDFCVDFILTTAW